MVISKNLPKLQDKKQNNIAGPPAIQTDYLGSGAVQDFKPIGSLLGEKEQDGTHQIDVLAGSAAHGIQH